MGDEHNKNDHDALVTLVANVGNLKDGQDKFHIEMKEAFKDLKDNFATKINDQGARIDAHEVRLNTLDTASRKTTLLLSIGSFLLSILLALVYYHITKQM